MKNDRPVAGISETLTSLPKGVDDIMSCNDA